MDRMERPLIRTLIIEDTANYAALLKEMLTESAPFEFSVTCAGTLTAGLAYLAKQSFDLVLLDLHLPDVEGSTGCEKIRAAAPSLPIIVVSATPEEEKFADECLQKGAQDYLTKGSFDQKLLLHSVRYATQRKKIETEYQLAQRALVEANQALVQKVRELDRLNTTMMGREERILELKEEIKALKAERAGINARLQI